MKLISTIGMLIILLLAGCGQAKQNIKFEVQNFKIEYKSDVSEISTNETYTGQGIIIATGDPRIVKEPYLVLIRITKTKGGLETDTDNIKTYTVPVYGGTGIVETYDSHYSISSTYLPSPKLNPKFEKPEYKIEILGYSTLVPCNP